jgi:hypothetical protein
MTLSYRYLFTHERINVLFRAIETSFSGKESFVQTVYLLLVLGSTISVSSVALLMA